MGTICLHTFVTSEYSNMKYVILFANVLWSQTQSQRTLQLSHVYSEWIIIIGTTHTAIRKPHDSNEYFEPYFVSAELQPQIHTINHNYRCAYLLRMHPYASCSTIHSRCERVRLLCSPITTGHPISSSSSSITIKSNRTFACTFVPCRLHRIKYVLVYFHPSHLYAAIYSFSVGCESHANRPYVTLGDNRLGTLSTLCIYATTRQVHVCFVHCAERGWLYFVSAVAMAVRIELVSGIAYMLNAEDNRVGESACDWFRYRYRSLFSRNRNVPFPKWQSIEKWQLYAIESHKSPLACD